jgi:hypothetical protein
MDVGVIIISVMGIAIGSAAILGIVLAGIKHEETKIRLNLAGGETDAANTALASEVARLADRVAVLEKLVTDDDRRLAGDIERLRRDNHSSVQA